MWCARSFFIVYKNLFAKFIQSFPYWGDGGLPTATKHLLIHPSPPNFCFLPPKVNSTQEKNKNVIFSCSHCSCTIFVLISYSFETQIMPILILIGVQYSQNVVFSFETFSNRQNHSSSDSHYLVKKVPSAVFTTFWYKVRETPKILREKEQ